MLSLAMRLVQLLWKFNKLIGHGTQFLNVSGAGHGWIAGGFCAIAGAITTRLARAAGVITG
jgi:hypothetical protein